MKLTKSLLTALAFILATVFSAACGPASGGEERTTQSLAGLSFPAEDETAGVHPSQSVMADSSNPFRKVDLRQKDKWEQFNGLSLHMEERIIARFYFWATLLALEPNGENQFMTALVLRDLAVAEGNDPSILQRCVQALVAVIEHFPEDLSYNAEGYPYKIADAARHVLQEMALE